MERGKRGDLRPADVSRLSRRVGTTSVGGLAALSGGYFCRRCDAWLGSLGLEPTPELYVEHLVEVLRVMRRVLKPGGTLCLNLGDSYAGNGTPARHLSLAAWSAAHARAGCAQARAGRSAAAQGDHGPQDQGPGRRPLAGRIRAPVRRLVPALCVLAGTSHASCCPSCGQPWRRVVGVTYAKPGNRRTNGPRSREWRRETPGFLVRLERRVSTTGWEPRCACEAEPEPAVVLDPFAGSGITLAVAAAIRRRVIGIELSSDYVDLLRERCALVASNPTTEEAA